MRSETMSAKNSVMCDKQYFHDSILYFIKLNIRNIPFEQIFSEIKGLLIIQSHIGERCRAQEYVNKKKTYISILYSFRSNDVQVQSVMNHSHCSLNRII